MGIVWETPEVIDVVQSKKSKNELLFEALMENPGQWGRIGTAKNHKAAYGRSFLIRKEAKEMNAGKFEFTARKLGNNQGAIYARFLGDTVLPEYAYQNVGFVIST